MTTKTTRDPSVIWAEKLWERLVSSLLDAEKTIIAIIDAKAWEPLGYESFGKAWIDRMSTVTVAVEMRPHVVYQMFSEGLSPEEVSNAVKGIGADTAEVLKEQQDAGVPADQATQRRRRSVPRPRTTIFVHVGEVALAEYERKAAAAGRKVEDIAREAISAAFGEL